MPPVDSPCLDGGNAASYLRALGLAFRAALWSHMRGHAVGAGAGGAQLMMDMAQYAHSVGAFGVSALEGPLQQLRGMANIHLMDEAGLRPLLRDLIAAGTPVAELRRYLETHEHYSPAWADYLPGPEQ